MAARTSEYYESSDSFNWRQSSCAPLLKSRDDDECSIGVATADQFSEDEEQGVRATVGCNADTVLKQAVFQDKLDGNHVISRLDGGRSRGEGYYHENLIQSGRSGSRGRGVGAGIHPQRDSDRETRLSMPDLSGSTLGTGMDSSSSRLRLTGRGLDIISTSPSITPVCLSSKQPSVISSSSSSKEQRDSRKRDLQEGFTCSTSRSLKVSKAPPTNTQHTQQHQNINGLNSKHASFDIQNIEHFVIPIQASAKGKTLKSVNKKTRSSEDLEVMKENDYEEDGRVDDDEDIHRHGGGGNRLTEGQDGDIDHHERFHSSIVVRPKKKKRKYFCTPENMLRLLLFSGYHFLDYWSNIGATAICFYWCSTGIAGTFSGFTGVCGCVVVLMAGCFSTYLAFNDKYFFRLPPLIRALVCIIPMGLFQGQIYKLAFHRYIRRKSTSGDFASSSEGSPYEILSSSIPGFRFHTKAFLGAYESVFFAGVSAFMLTRDIQHATEQPRIDSDGRIVSAVTPHPGLALWETMILSTCLGTSLWTLAHVCVEVDYRVSGFIKERTDASICFSLCCILGRMVEVASIVMTLGFIVRVIFIILGSQEVVSFCFVVFYWLYGVLMLRLVSPHEKNVFVHFLTGFMFMCANLTRFVDHPGFARSARVLTWRMRVLRGTVLSGLLIGGLIAYTQDYSKMKVGDKVSDAPNKSFFVMMWEQSPILLGLFSVATAVHLIYAPWFNKFIVQMDDRDVFLLAAEGKAEKLKQVLTKDVHNLTVCVNHRRDNGRAPLHLAAQYHDDTDTIKILISHGKADINLPTSRGKTAFHLAAEHGNLKTVMLLQSVGAMVNLQDTEGNTALHLAALKHHNGIVKFLVEKEKCRTDIENNNGQMWYDMGEYTEEEMRLAERQNRRRQLDSNWVGVVSNSTMGGDTFTSSLQAGSMQAGGSMASSTGRQHQMNRGRSISSLHPYQTSKSRSGDMLAISMGEDETTPLRGLTPSGRTGVATGCSYSSAGVNGEEHHRRRRSISHGVPVGTSSGKHNGNGGHSGGNLRTSTSHLSCASSGSNLSMRMNIEPQMSSHIPSENPSHCEDGPRETNTRLVRVEPAEMPPELLMHVNQRGGSIINRGSLGDHHLSSRHGGGITSVSSRNGGSGGGDDAGNNSSNYDRRTWDINNRDHEGGSASGDAEMSHYFPSAVATLRAHHQILRPCGLSSLILSTATPYTFGKFFLRTVDEERRYLEPEYQKKMHSFREQTRKLRAKVHRGTSCSQSPTSTAGVSSTSTTIQSVGLSPTYSTVPETLQPSVSRSTQQHQHQSSASTTTSGMVLQQNSNSNANRQSNFLSIIDTQNYFPNRPRTSVDGVLHVDPLTLHSYSMASSNLSRVSLSPLSMGGSYMEAADGSERLNIVEENAVVKFGGCVVEDEGDEVDTFLRQDGDHVECSSISKAGAGSGSSSEIRRVKKEPDEEPDSRGNNREDGESDGKSGVSGEVLPESRRQKQLSLDLGRKSNRFDGFSAPSKNSRDSLGGIDGDCDWGPGGEESAESGDGQDFSSPNTSPNESPTHAEKKRPPVSHCSGTTASRHTASKCTEVKSSPNGSEQELSSWSSKEPTDESPDEDDLDGEGEEALQEGEEYCPIKMIPTLSTTTAESSPTDLLVEPHCENGAWAIEKRPAGANQHVRRSPTKSSQPLQLVSMDNVPPNVSTNAPLNDFSNAGGSSSSQHQCSYKKESPVKQAAASSSNMTPVVARNGNETKGGSCASSINSPPTTTYKNDPSSEKLISSSEEEATLRKQELDKLRIQLHNELEINEELQRGTCMHPKNGDVARSDPRHGKEVEKEGRKALGRLCPVPTLCEPSPAETTPVVSKEASREDIPSSKDRHQEEKASSSKRRRGESKDETTSRSSKNPTPRNSDDENISHRKNRGLVSNGKKRHGEGNEQDRSNKEDDPKRSSSKRSSKDQKSSSSKDQQRVVSGNNKSSSSSKRTSASLKPPPKRRDPLSHIDWDMLGPQDFGVISQLGKGTWGTVMKVSVKDDPTTVLAMKLLDKQQYKVQKIVCRYYAEEHVLRTVSHPFIVLLYATFSTPTHWMLLMEYCPGGNLHDILVKEGQPGLERVVALKACSEILLALEFLHSRGIIFRDLKCENVILSANRTCRLTDFGLAKEDLEADQVKGVYSFCGSYGYCAPEVMALKTPKKKEEHSGYGNSVDIYSLGVLLYMLIQGGQITRRRDRTSGRVQESRFPPMTHDEFRAEVDSAALLDASCSGGGSGLMQFPTDRTKYRAMKEKANRWNKHEHGLELVRIMTNDKGSQRGTCETVKGHKYFKHVDFQAVLHNSPGHFGEVRKKIWAEEQREVAEKEAEKKAAEDRAAERKAAAEQRLRGGPVGGGGENNNSNGVVNQNTSNSGDNSARRRAAKNQPPLPAIPSYRANHQARPVTPTRGQHEQPSAASGVQQQQRERASPRTLRPPGEVSPRAQNVNDGGVSPRKRAEQRHFRSAPVAVAPSPVGDPVMGRTAAPNKTSPAVVTGRENIELASGRDDRRGCPSGGNNFQPGGNNPVGNNSSGRVGGESCRAGSSSSAYSAQFGGS